MFVARLACFELDFHSSKGVLIIGIEHYMVVAWILYSFFRRISVWAMKDLVQECCLSSGRWNEPPYLVDVYLVRPW